MAYRYFKSASGGGTMISIFRCPANGSGVFEQSPADVEEYRSDGTWARGQREKLWKDASSGWFAESDDEISADRAVQLMSKISEAARQQGPAQQTQPPGPPDPPKNIPATKIAADKQSAGAVPSPTKKARPVRRFITLGTALCLLLWIVTIIVKLIHKPEPIIRPLHPDGMQSSVSAPAPLPPDNELDPPSRILLLNTR